MNWNLYLVAHSAPKGFDPLPQPTVVATITADPRFLGKLNPIKELNALAAKMLIVDFTVQSAEAHDLPGHQMGLPFPPRT